MRILLEPGGEGGNGFLTTLPEEIRGEPSLASFKDVGGLAKSYVESQKLLGHKRVALPGEKATDAEWDAFYNSIGRPESIDKYEAVSLKDKDGKVIFEPDKTELGELHKMFHKIGLTNKQARAMQEYSLNFLHKNKQTQENDRASASAKEVQGLREDWGDKFDTNVDIAKSVVKKFGDEQVGAFLEESGLGNNVPLIKFLHKVGMSMLEDSGRRGSGGELPLGDKARAANEIAVLTNDPTFQKQLGDAMDPGHMAALERWTNLFKVAYPGVSD